MVVTFAQHTLPREGKGESCSTVNNSMRNSSTGPIALSQLLRHSLSPGPLNWTWNSEMLSFTKSTFQSLIILHSSKLSAEQHNTSCAMMCGHMGSRSVAVTHSLRKL